MGSDCEFLYKESKSQVQDTGFPSRFDTGRTTGFGAFGQDRHESSRIGDIDEKRGDVGELDDRKLL